MNSKNAIQGAVYKTQLTEEDVAKQERLHAYIHSREERNGKPPTNLPKLIPDSVLLKTIDDTKKDLQKVAWAMRKRYPADYKDFNKRLDELVIWVTEHKASNNTLQEMLLAIMKEIREHPTSAEVKQIDSDRESRLGIFGKDHSICIYGGRVCIRREDHFDWILPEQLRAFYAHLEIPGIDGKPQNVVSAFMEWDGARRYKEVIFNPARPGHYEECYNVWQGWMVEPEDGIDDLPWWEVLEAACGYNQDYLDYVTKWFADIVQNPARNPGTAIGISGRQGIGKSALVETMGMLMSTINRTGDSKIVRGAFGDFTLDELLAEYNEHVANKLLVYLDEATWGGSHIEQQRMKKVITKETENINPKFLGRISLPCYRRVIFSSNNEFYYRPDKDDRRLLPLEYDTSKINDKSFDFWGAFYEKRKNGKMLQNLLYRLQHVDLTEWHPQSALKKLKITTGGSMLANTLQPWEHWLEEVARQGAITTERTDGDNHKYETIVEIESRLVNDDDFENAYLLWTRKHRVNGSWYSDAFKKERTKMLGPQVRKMVNGVKYVMRNVPSSKEMLNRLREGRRWQMPEEEMEEYVPPAPVEDGLITM